ncbi:DmsC/YnfH family molybdoenzyme membrane anchor subunit [Pseudorhodobacter sp. MZDSW-24AT]|uniref:dimethyl sulfoxide reductase anchor subunit family protein n=1 Tax=Pseudorhodobacter sp. MZDSW-24AT TaxID=2052957 RepID=UPI000C1EFAFB|nr:DmsC/YnfH family molybdoenzyme membrane anchor subunit [Pseudorhodobacter sp. MZDSW-24AT]PJF11147.1 dibenzothiophene desulfurase [Pseudorhodobacter sp. MZDSW-24AT]
MNPAPSVIVFTVLSGMGFGYLALLATFHDYSGAAAFWHWAFGYVLATIGLMASVFHLGNPQRAWRAFTQWRSSWLSREAWGAVLTLLAFAPLALSDWLGLGLPRGFGWLGAALALATVLATGMIYAQIRAVPRWHHWSVPLLFLAYAVAGGCLLAGFRVSAILALVAVAITLWLHWRIGDGAFARAGSTLGSATGLGARGAVSVFEPAHTAGSYLLREMIYVVGRRHVPKLRMLALGAGVAAPVLALLLVPGTAGFGLAILLYLVGALAQRWLFFAQAEHVVGLYYGKR